MDFGEDIIEAAKNDNLEKIDLQNINIDDLESLEKETFDFDPLG